MTAAHAPVARFVNRTRRATSIPTKLWTEGRPHLIPLYGLLLSSDLAREGIVNSGSYAFADHIYRNRASGRWGFGPLIDRLVLSMPSARSFRSRFRHARNAIVQHARDWPVGEPIQVLSVPCGIARDVVEAAATLRDQYGSIYARLSCTGLDLDPVPLALTEREVAARGLRPFRLLAGDALSSDGLPPGQTLITSMGFGEFLTDDELVTFFRECAEALVPGGWLVTSATRRHALSDYLLRNLGELHTHYREAAQLVALLSAAGFDDVRWHRDAVGLQTLVVAVRS
jgi:hypothetical protein